MHLYWWKMTLFWVVSVLRGISAGSGVFQSPALEFSAWEMVWEWAGSRVCQETKGNCIWWGGDSSSSQDSAAQKWPLQGATAGASLLWAGFHTWYWLVIISLLELGRTLAQVDRTQFHSVLFYVCAGDSAAPQRCTSLQLFPWNMKQVQCLSKNGEFLKSWPVMEESL